jgi:hypothetical protein
MKDQPGAAKLGLSRRTLLRSVPIIAGAMVSATAISGEAFAQKSAKISHEMAKYQDQPKNGQKCSACSQFQPPSSCKIVADPISPNGWCQYFTPKQS